MGQINQNYLTDGVKGMAGTVNAIGETMQEHDPRMHDVCMALLAPNKPIAINIHEPSDWEDPDGRAIKALEKENLLARANVLLGQRSAAGSLCTQYIYLRTPNGQMAYECGLRGEANFDLIF